MLRHLANKLAQHLLVNFCPCTLAQTQPDPATLTLGGARGRQWLPSGSAVCWLKGQLRPIREWWTRVPLVQHQGPKTSAPKMGASDCNVILQKNSCTSFGQFLPRTSAQNQPDSGHHPNPLGGSRSAGAVARRRGVLVERPPSTNEAVVDEGYFSLTSGSHNAGTKDGCL